MPKQKNDQREPQKKQYSHVLLIALAVLMFIGLLLILILSGHDNAPEKTSEPVQTPTTEGQLGNEDYIPVEVAPMTPAPESPIWDPDNEDMSTENTACAPNEPEKTYQNDRVLEMDVSSGMHLKVGINDESAEGGIYINPEFSFDEAYNDNEKYGFIITPSRGFMEYYTDNADKVFNGINAGEKQLCVIGRAYDQCIPASYKSPEAYGARWINSVMYDANDAWGATLTIRIVRLSSRSTVVTNDPDGLLLGIVKLDINYDERTQTYYMSTLRPADVKAEGMLSFADRQDAIDKAVEYLVNGNGRYQFGATETNLLVLSDSIVVERRTNPYYNKLFDADGNVIPAGKLAGCEIFAVNIPDYAAGSYTVYLIPESQSAYHLASSTSADGSKNLVVAGYDPIMPFSMQSLENYMLPEDFEAFRFNQ